MTANDDLAYKMCHIVGSHIWLLAAFYYALENKFMFPFIVSTYVICYIFGKLYDWPIRIYVNERVGYMQRMSNRRYKHMLSGPSELFID